jgi:hypothetical protein
MAGCPVGPRRAPDGPWRAGRGSAADWVGPSGSAQVKYVFVFSNLFF